LTTWLTAAAGGYQTFAIKTDNTLWAWGDNYYGNLGIGTSGSGTKRSSPVQVGALTNWLTVSSGRYHTVAVKTNGTLWAIGGYNRFGELGLGDANDKSSPVQIGAQTNWAKVSTGYNHTAAIKTDGTLWATGYNSYGGLGVGDSTHRSSPVQIGALTTWSNVFCGAYFTLAIKPE
jgi:alpha-tubulin suppressor-like RCC1 family protein